MEDDELDLAFSPLFTPALENRLTYNALLGTDYVNEALFSVVMLHLQESPMVMPILLPTGESVLLPVPEVGLRRYVKRLHLTDAIPDRLKPAIAEQVSIQDQPAICLNARDPLWQGEERLAIFDYFLNTMAQHQRLTPEKIFFLTDCVRTYRPRSLQDIERQLTLLIQSCERDLSNLSGRGFHSHQLQEKFHNAKAGHAEGHDEQSVVANYTRMIRLSKALLDELNQQTERVSAS
jgi:hypothetical protein